MTVYKPLITATELQACLDNPKTKVFDVRGTWKGEPRALPSDYESGHIPGAVFLDWTQHFLEQGVELRLASVASYEEARVAFRELGIDKDDHVVLYDDYHHMFAGRLWWAMRYWGFERVQVLNGGWSYWCAQALPVSQTKATPNIGDFEPQEQSLLRVSLEALLKDKAALCLLDGRGEQNYQGDPKDSNSGHIPGAINIPFRRLLDEASGLFLPTNQLAQVFDERIENWREKPLVSSCGSGYSGTLPMLALAILGVDPSLFDGSIAQWKQDPNRPVKQGSEP